MAILADSFYYQELRIDTINTRVFADLVAKEGDANGRGLLVTLTENGLMKDTTGIALNLKWEHTSVGNQGVDNFEALDLSKGLYKITYPTEMLNRGKIRAFIQIIDSGKLAGIKNIEITVDRGVGDDTAIASSDSFTALAQALIDVNNLESTYAPELLSVKQQLAEAATKAELDETNVSVNLKADKTYVDTKIATVVSGSPKGVYATLSALQSAYPSGNTNIYVVSADGNWYYWSGTTWASGGVYQSEKLADNSVLLKNLSDDIVKKIHNIKDYSVASNALTDFTAIGTTALSLDGVYIKALSSGEPVKFKQYKDWGLPIGDKILVTFKARANKMGNIIIYLLTNNVGGVLSSTSQTISATERTVSVVMSGPTLCNGIYFDSNDFTASGDYVEILDLVVSDLSPVFGSGNEPTANEAWHYMWSSNNKYTDTYDLLMADNIKGTTVYTVKGTGVYTITHKALLSEATLTIRTDIITIVGSIFTETRTAFTGDTVTITTNTSTLITEVV